MQLRLQDIEIAWQSRDPALPELFCKLVTQTEPTTTEPLREGAITFETFVREMKHPAFTREYPSKLAQMQYRINTIKLLESAEAERPLSACLTSHQLLMQLWQDNSYFARHCLLKIIAQVPLVYGPWRALKQIFKQAEAKHDTEIFGALAARFDLALTQGAISKGVSHATLRYLCRRAWRYLRHTGQGLPVCYADYAVDVLACYPDNTHWQQTWVANHIFYHDTRQYNKNRFRVSYQNRKNLLQQRAFPELWQRTPRPLFNLLERAQAEQVRRFAIDSLKQDFRAALREVQPQWVARLVDVHSTQIDQFVVWILDNVPRFEQAAFRELGLHDAVLSLFDSPADSARVYAANYARTHARDLSITDLIRLANNDNAQVRKLAQDLLLAKDPRKAVGLEAWGHMLEMPYSHELAAQILRKHFGSRELTPAWFKSRLLAVLQHKSDFFDTIFVFLQKLLAHLYTLDQLGTAFFCDLLVEVEALQTELNDETQQIFNFALTNLRQLDVNTLESELLQRLLLHPLAMEHILSWIDEGVLKTQHFSIAFFKSLAYHRDWENDTFIQQLRKSDVQWVKNLTYDESLAEQILTWLQDVRRFDPTALGLDWLMELVQRNETRYHDTAVAIMLKAFTPADFAPATQSAAPTIETTETVDLDNDSFLFTGKLATMTRKQAEEKVKHANGILVSGVTQKLNYLVIGDEGSPLYGQGRKGSKQVKAEKLIAEGAKLQIISETAFLQRLEGKHRAFSTDTTLAGCEYLWAMATDANVAADAPAAKFALQYLRLHHPQICLAKTDRPVDPGAEIPAEFLSFVQIKPLFTDKRANLRRFALELGKWELLRWSPPYQDLVRFCESPYPEVRQFIADAFLQTPSPDNQHYHLDASQLSPVAVYSFCESQDAETRELGMTLIARHSHLSVPDALFKLTESPDHQVRSFVVKKLWSLYQQRAITRGWQPNVPPQSQVGQAAQKQAATKLQSLGIGAPQRPKQLPADYAELKHFLRRMLFEIPPARPAKGNDEGLQIEKKLKPLPARKAKLALIDTLRDIALTDGAFAQLILPLLEEFMLSKGKSEQAACLVAVTRIKAVL